MPEATNTTRVVVSDIEKAVEKGVNLICATCPFYHESRLAGNPSCGKDCGGPLSSRDFPLYTGQIPRSKFDKLCLMCGDSNLACKIVVPGNAQRFGFCEKHKDTFDGIVPNPNSVAPTIPMILPILQI